MIHPHPPIMPHHKATREKTDTGRPSFSRFRDLLRKKPKPTDEENSHSPSLFSLVHQEAKDSFSGMSDENNKEKSLDSVLDNLITPPPSPSASQSTHIQEGKSDISLLPANAPWQTVLESTSHSIAFLISEEVKETSFILNGPLFANTPLAGIKLTVREYSTAPLSFNIHFACAPAALAFLQPHLKTLASVFQNRRYPFSVHSVDADLGEGIPPPISGEEKDDEFNE